MIRKADIILAIILIILGLFISYISVSDNREGTSVTVTIDGKPYASYPLAEDKVIEISEKNHINKITIKNGTVSMTFSDCTNQDCVLHSPIHRTGETIVCLPHKLVVEITGDDYEFDAISK